MSVLSATQLKAMTKRPPETPLVTPEQTPDPTPTQTPNHTPPVSPPRQNRARESQAEGDVPNCNLVVAEGVEDKHPWQEEDVRKVNESSRDSKSQVGEVDDA